MYNSYFYIPIHRILISTSIVYYNNTTQFCTVTTTLMYKYSNELIFLLNFLFSFLYFYIKGQLEWVNNLRWSGQAQFLNASRQTLVINGLVEGYFRESERLRFYWINVAGQLVIIYYKYFYLNKQH